MEILKPYKIVEMNVIELTKGITYELVTNVVNCLNENVTVYLTETKDELYFTDCGYNLWNKESLGEVVELFEDGTNIEIVGNEIILKIDKNASPSERKHSLHDYLEWLQKHLDFRVLEVV